MSDYIQESIVRLKRKYGKDELVSSLIKKESDLQIEIGILKSEKDELQYLLNKYKKRASNKVEGNFCNTDLYKSFREQIKDLKNKVKSLNTANSKLICKLAVKNLESITKTIR